MRPPDEQVAELLRNGNGFGKAYNDTVARVRDAECGFLAVLVALYGLNGSKMSNAQWCVVARMDAKTVRKHFAHLEEDGIIKGQGGGRGRGNRRWRVPRYPVEQDPKKAPPTWEPPASAGLKRGNGTHFDEPKQGNGTHINGETAPILEGKTAGQPGLSPSTDLVLGLGSEVPQVSKEPNDEAVTADVSADSCPQTDPWRCACCDAPLNRDQYRAGQGVCSDCWKEGRRTAA
jgi:hypothetical protein